MTPMGQPVSSVVRRWEPALRPQMTTRTRVSDETRKKIGGRLGRTPRLILNCCVVICEEERKAWPPNLRHPQKNLRYLG